MPVNPMVLEVRVNIILMYPRLNFLSQPEDIESSNFFEKDAKIIECSTSDYSIMQTKYRDLNWNLIPNTIIVKEGKPLFQINSLGLKGGKSDWPKKKELSFGGTRSSLVSVWAGSI